MNQLINIYFKNGSYLQAFFKDYQSEKNETRFIAETLSPCFQTCTCLPCAQLPRAGSFLADVRLGTGTYKVTWMHA